MNKKNSFVLYTDYREMVEMLPVKERGILFHSLFEYVEDGTIKDFSDSPALNMCFSFIRSQIDRDTKKYNERCEQNRINGSKGGKATASNGKQLFANQADNDTETDNDNEDETDNGK